MVEYLEDEYEELGENNQEAWVSYIYVSDDEDGNVDHELLDTEGSSQTEQPIKKPLEEVAGASVIVNPLEASDVEYIYADGFTENNEIIIGEMPKFQCEECNRVFKRHDSLTKHRMVHLGVTACNSCGVTFSRFSHLKRHIRVKHPDWKLAPRRSGRPSRNEQVRSTMRKHVPAWKLVILNLSSFFQAPPLLLIPQTDTNQP